MKRNAKKTARRIVGYVRVSTADQAESGLSLESQRERLAAWCSLYDAELVCVFDDAGASAKSLKGRDGLAAALAMVEAGEADGVLVAKLDRLTRSVRDLGDLVDRAERGGWALVSVAEQLDTSTAAGRLVLNVLGAVSQWEREACAERTSAALQAKRARGERNGELRIGETTADDGRTLVADDAEAEALDIIRTLRTGADGAKPMSIRAIAAELNARGVPARGSQWHATTVARVLRRIEAA